MAKKVAKSYIDGFQNLVDDIYKDFVRIESYPDIFANGLYNWLLIGLHFPVIPIVCYGTVKIVASLYWMFEHTIYVCTPNYWIHPIVGI